MRTVSELPHAKLVRFGNRKMRLFHFGTLTEEMRGVEQTSCAITKDEIESATFNEKIDLQYLISCVRNKLN